MSTKVLMALLYWIAFLVFMGFYFYVDTIEEYRDSEQKTGVVVQQLYQKGRWTRGKWYRFPQIRFVYQDSAYLFGEPQIFAPSRYRVGKKVKVIYPKGQPGKARIYSFFSYWISLTQLFFSFMFALFVFVSVIFFGWYREFRFQQTRQRP